MISEKYQREKVGEEIPKNDKLKRANKERLIEEMKRSGGRKENSGSGRERRERKWGRREIKNKGADGEEWGGKWEGEDASNLWA